MSMRRPGACGAISVDCAAAGAGLRPITRTAADHRCLVGLLIASLEMPVRRRRATTVGQGAQTRPLSATNSLRGGRAWWAHFEFTRINTAPTFLRKKIEEQLN